MGGRFSRSRGEHAPRAASSSKNKADVVDISVHSTASHQARKYGGSDAQLVLENILIDEAEVDGEDAARVAGLEALRSEELRDASAGAHSQAARYESPCQNGHLNFDCNLYPGSKLAGLSASIVQMLNSKGMHKYAVFL